MLNLVRGLRIGSRIYILTAMSLIFLSVVAAISFFSMTRIGQELTQVADRSMPISDIAARIALCIFDSKMQFESELVK